MMILIVEDTVEIAEVYALILTDEGHSVIHKENGKEAIDYLNNAESPLPDLLITDWMMPIMDGAALIALIRLDHRLKHLPIIVSSGSLGFERYEAFLKASCHFLPKPCEMQTLINLVTEVTK